MLKITNRARNLGEILDPDPNFSSHTKTTTKSAYYHLGIYQGLKDFGKTSMHLSSADPTTTVTVSLQDFTEFIRKLQLMQNAAAQDKDQNNRSYHSSS